MKKVLSFVLVLAMILGTVSMAFAAPFDGKATTVISAENTVVPFADAEDNAVTTVLRDLGILDGDENGNVNVASNLTRAEAAKIVVVAMGLGEQGAVKTTTKFTDVKKADWYSGYVAVAAAYGYMDGVGGGKFNPEANLTMEEAATIICKLLGYDAAHMKNEGTWPENYRERANKIKFVAYKDVTSAKATRGDFFKMIFNVLNDSDETVGTGQHLVKWVQTTEYQAGWDKASTLNLYQKMSKYVNATATHIGSVYTFTDVEVITTEKFDNGFDASAYVGLNATILKKHSVAIGLVSTAGVTLQGTFDATCTTFTAVDGKEYTFAKTTMAATAKTVINNKVNADGSGTYDYTTKATATLSVVLDKYDATKVKEVYSQNYWYRTNAFMITASEAAAFANGYASVAALAKVADGFVDYTFKTTNTSITDKTQVFYEPYVIFEGAATKYADLQENDVVEVYCENNATNGLVTKLVVTRNVVNGPVTKVNGKDRTIVVNDTTYKFDVAVKNNFFNSNGTAKDNAVVVSASDRALYLTAKGEVFYATIPGVVAKIGKAQLAFVRATGYTAPKSTHEIDVLGTTTVASIALLLAGETESKIYTLTPSAFEAAVKDENLTAEGFIFNDDLSATVVSVKFYDNGEIASIELATIANTNSPANNSITPNAVGVNYAKETSVVAGRYSTKAVVVELQNNTGKVYSSQDAFYKPVTTESVKGYTLNGQVYVVNGSVALVVYSKAAKEAVNGIESKVTLAAYVDKYTEKVASRDVYYATFKTMGSDETTTYKVSSDFYNALVNVGLTFTLQLEDETVATPTAYAVSSSALYAFGTTKAAVVVKDGLLYASEHALYVEYMTNGGTTTTFGIVTDTAVLKTAETAASGVALVSVEALEYVALDENVMIYKYTYKDAVYSVAKAGEADVAKATVVAAFDVNGDKFVDVILLDYDKADSTFSDEAWAKYMFYKDSFAAVTFAE